MINKFLKNKQYRLCILTLLMTIQGGLGWCGFSNTSINWIISFIFIYTLLQYKNQSQPLILINIYLIWLLIGIIRGLFVPENYWEWKQLVTGSLTLSLPLLVFPFQSYTNTQAVLSHWLKYAIPCCILLLLFTPNGSYHFYIAPIFLLGCFLPLMPSKWKIIIGGLLLIMLVSNLGARSQVIKAGITIIIALGVYFSKFIPTSFLKLIHCLCFGIPITLLFLGISGTFNIFEELSKNEDKYIEKKIVNGQVVEENLSADTRTFIYEEVIESAVKHNYVIWGRTPARGNDSDIFGTLTAEILKTGKYERHTNELCHPNIFTWLGIIGVILYSLIYLRSSYLAVYKSNNIYIKFLGCFIAFRWAFGWIEDINRFDIANIALWMIIAIGFSTQFRLMENSDFRLWFKKIFHKL